MYIFIFIQSNPSLILHFVCLTSKIIARINTKLITIMSIVLNTSTDGIRVCTVTFKLSINGTNGRSKSLSRNDQRMAIVHPIP